MSKKNAILILCVLIILGAAVSVFIYKVYQDTMLIERGMIVDPHPVEPAVAEVTTKTDIGDPPIEVQQLLNSNFTVEGKMVKFINGIAIEPIAPGSGSLITTKYFGNDVRGDFNNDGREDFAFVLTRSGVGSSTFYYVVAGLRNNKNGYTGTTAILLGDRISPQSTEVVPGKDGGAPEIVINYTDRKKSEPMTAQPTVGVSRYFRIAGGDLVEVPKK